MLLITATTSPESDRLQPPSTAVPENTAASSSGFYLSVNADLDKTAAKLDDRDAVTGDATVASDGDSGTLTTFTDEYHDYQLDFVHVGRTVNYYLWDDGTFSLDQHNGIVLQVVNEVSR